MKKYILILVALITSLGAWAQVSAPAGAGISIGFVIFLILIGLAAYFIPAFVAKGKENSVAIFFLNLFLGWTLLGWVGALIWACVTPRKGIIQKKIDIAVTNAPAPETSSTPEPKQEHTSVADELLKLAQLKDSGVLSEEEFNAQKAKLLK